MFTVDDIWYSKIAGALGVDKGEVVAELPPDKAMGDIGFPMFAFAKRFKKPPAQIASDLAAKLVLEAELSALGAVRAAGPYLNISLNRGAFAKKLLSDAKQKGSSLLKGKRIMVEFSSPNTNKPLHLGHLRNDVLGESLSRILKAAGAQVQKVSIINDRGVHICKSMLAYETFRKGETPESTGTKSDKFVGECYVLFGKMSKEDKTAEEKAQEMLRKWEAGDAATIALWKKMNGWALDGMKATYARTDVSFDKFYFESDTYLLGKEKVEEGIKKGIFYREEDGSAWIDLEEEKLGKKLLLRGDGTSVYITQDIGLAITRHGEWAFDQLVYVVGSEQIYHFKVLFSMLKKFGFEWADNLYHLAYGMVNLPEGKMKSREGTVVDADDLIDALKEMALSEIREKEREDAVGDADAVAEKVALGALHYFLLQVSPLKDMMFNPRESLSFNGNTGPYLQYSGARISSMLKKIGGEISGAANGAVDYSLLSGEPEWELLKTMAGFKGAVEDAARKMDSSIMAGYCYELAKSFSRFYHDCPILNCGDKSLSAARLVLAKEVLAVLKEALYLICVPFLETM